jgi:hypothetical protein
MRNISLSVIVIFYCTSGLACKHASVWSEPEKEIKMVMAKHYNMTQDIMGSKMALSAGTTFSFGIKIKGDDKVINVTLKINHIEMDALVGGQKKKYDSDNKEDLKGTMGNSFKKLLNNAVHMEVSGKDGKVISKGESNQTSEALAALSWVDFDKQFAKELFFFYTDTIAGSRFTVTENDENDKHSSIEYTLDSVVNNGAFFHFTGNNFSKFDKSIGGMVVTSISENAISGNLIVDINTHIIRQKSTNFKGTGKTIASKQTMPFIIDQTIVTTTQ